MPEAGEQADSGSGGQAQARHDAIVAIHASGRQYVLAVTGGGSVAISDVLSVPGGSSSFLEAIVPYSAASLADWLKRAPERFCSPETALSMAVVAFERARKLASATSATDAENVSHLRGISCTAALVSDRPKRGEHRCYVAVQSDRTTTLMSVVLEKNARTRAAEERIAGDLVLSMLAQTAGLPEPLEVALRSTESVETQHVVADSQLADVWLNRSSHIWSLPDFEFANRLDQPPGALLSGAFAPRHSGHVALREASEQYLGRPVYFELSISNAEKSPLDYLTIKQRRQQFGDYPVALTNAATFAEKARLFPSTVFVIGVDTAERVVQPRFYGGSETRMREWLDELRQLGCRFLVAGRKMESTFRTLRDIHVPSKFTDLFEELPEPKFRQDISSTEIRRNRHAPDTE